MKNLRGFNVIKQDGVYSLSSTYNELDEEGNLVKRNMTDSFFVLDPQLQGHLEAIEEYIKTNRFGQG